jgi:uncharacterized protein
MLMSRRAPADWRETLRISLWPRRSWKRSLRYGQLRLQRLQVLPRSLALGAAAGVFVAILPIPGVQLLAAAGLAWLVRGHSGTAALATFAANPLTYPLIWVASYALGAMILGTPVSNATHDLDMISDVMAKAWTPSAFRTVLPALTTLTVGAIPLAIVAAASAYVGVRMVLRKKRLPVFVATQPPMHRRPVVKIPRHRPRPQAQPAKIAA